MTSFDQVIAAPTGRFTAIERPYTVDEVLRLRGSFPVEHTLARRGALRLWELLQADEPVRALGAVTGNQVFRQPESPSAAPGRVQRRRSCWFRDPERWLAARRRVEDARPDREDGRR